MKPSSTVTTPVCGANFLVILMTLSPGSFRKTPLVRGAWHLRDLHAAARFLEQITRGFGAGRLAVEIVVDEEIGADGGDESGGQQDRENE